MDTSRKGKRAKKDEGQVRIAIVNEDKCKPKKCKLECKRNCPVVRMGKLCIEVKQTSKVAFISEPLCIGCGICVKKCPFEAIQIINLPKDLESQTTHRFGPNSFKLHRLPMPRPGQVLGLVGTNGIGKSTALKILAGKLKPNLGDFENAPEWETGILRYFRGSELQNYFTRILEDNLKAIVKPQYVDVIPQKARGTVRENLERRSQMGDEYLASITTDLELSHLMDREIAQLSGGELQRFAIAMVCIQKADVYMFDEPSSYLDVKQRLKAAQVIRSLLERETGDAGSRAYVIVVEHDLSVLDYLSDYVCVLYGTPGAYGVVTMPYGVREGINVFLAGFIPTENLRFRREELTFRVTEAAEEDEVLRQDYRYSYPTMTKTFPGKKGKKSSFSLTVEGGEFTDSELIVMLGQNGTGKTTFIRMLAGFLKPDDESVDMPTLSVSYKPQKISASFDGTVRQLLNRKIRASANHPTFQQDVIKPLQISHLMDQNVRFLSGGELQRVAIILALGTRADVYLLDEPSAYLDSEQRIITAKVIKRYILNTKKTAFIVEHDFIMATYLADRVIRYSGDPGQNCVAHAPEPLLTGMNSFLESLEITFRRDPTNYRPRINKIGSQKDTEQKASGNYFVADANSRDD